MSTRVLLTLFILPLLHALRLAPVSLGRPAAMNRADLLKTAAVGVASAFVAPALADDLDDDDLNNEDEIPDQSRMRSKPKGGKPPPPMKTDAAAGKAAYQTLLDARSQLKSLSEMVGKGDFAGASKAMDSAPYDDLENTLLVLVRSPVLGPDEKKAIGTIKRYGVGADVIIMLGGLNSAIKSGSGGDARTYITKAKEALDEVVVIGKSCGLSK